MFGFTQRLESVKTRATKVSAKAGHARSREHKISRFHIHSRKNCLREEES
jgi:hypothetical protein